MGLRGVDLRGVDLRCVDFRFMELRTVGLQTLPAKSRLLCWLLILQRKVERQSLSRICSLRGTLQVLMIFLAR